MFALSLGLYVLGGVLTGAGCLAVDRNLAKPHTVPAFVAIMLGWPVFWMLVAVLMLGHALRKTL